MRKIEKKDKTVVLLDVRDEREWNAEISSPSGNDLTLRKGRIPGAIGLVWTDLMEMKEGITFIKDEDEVEEICEKKGIYKDQEIIIYCLKGTRASTSWIALKRSGYSNVKNYFASWNEWGRDDSLPFDGEQY